MKITIQTPCGVSVEGLAQDCEIMAAMMRKRYARLKHTAMQTSGEAKRQAELEMRDMTRVMPTLNKIRDAVRTALANPQPAALTGETVAEYKKLGIDQANPNPDGSDFHLMTAIETKEDPPPLQPTQQTVSEEEPFLDL